MYLPFVWLPHLPIRLPSKSNRHTDGNGRVELLDCMFCCAPSSGVRRLHHTRHPASGASRRIVLLPLATDEGRKRNEMESADLLGIKESEGGKSVTALDRSGLRTRVDCRFEVTPTGSIFVRRQQRLTPIAHTRMAQAQPQQARRFRGDPVGSKERAIASRQLPSLMDRTHPGRCGL